MKLKPWMVSVLCLIIALPLVANSAFSAPITTADLIDPHRVDADCANHAAPTTAENERQSTSLLP